jgi:hypothetical protein
VTETAFGNCADCGRPRKPGAIFCECGALLDYSVAAGEQPTNGKSNGNAVAANGDAVADKGDASDAAELEWPPGPYQGLKEHTEGTTDRSITAVPCPNEKCSALNPKTFGFCWRCGTPMEQGVEAGPARGWSLRRTLRLEKSPLPAGERGRPRKPLLGKDPLTLLRAGLIVLAALLVLGAGVIAVVKFSRPAADHVTHWYGNGREALFPRFSSVIPSAVLPLRIEQVPPPVGRSPRSTRVCRPSAVGQRHKVRWRKISHPAADAFDRNLSTYWQSTTARDVTDQLCAMFNPSARRIDEVAVFAGDPTASTIVPAALQLTFFCWVPHPSRHRDCTSAETPRGKWKKGKEKGKYRVTGVGKVIKLDNTPSEQRFATGLEQNVSMVVITVRGVHPENNKKLKAAITDIEFFDRH